MKLQRGDVVLVHSDGFIGWAIRQIERYKDEKPSRVNHVGVITDFDPDHGPMITEALPTGTVKRPFEQAYADSGVWLTIVRHKGLNEVRINRVMRYMAAYVGHRYGFLKIALHLLQKWTGLKLTKLCVWDERPICSYAVAVAFAAADIHFGKPANECDPDDIDDFTRAHPHLWECVVALAPYENKEAA